MPTCTIAKLHGLNYYSPIHAVNIITKQYYYPGVGAYNFINIEFNSRSFYAILPHDLLFFTVQPFLPVRLP